MSNLYLPAKKYSGAGNVFLLIDDRDEKFPARNLSFIQKNCFLTNVDGILLLQKKEGGIQMRIFNKDGSEAESCGNGLRCMAKYLLDHHISSNHQIWMHDRWVSFFQEKNDQIGVKMGFFTDLKLNIATEKGFVHFVNTGVPHAIQFVEDPSSIHLNDFGPWLRHHPLFQPKGVNASVAKIFSDQKIQIRTFERGVEGETLACGTGALAVSAIAKSLYEKASCFLIQYPGGVLEVRFQEDQEMVLFGKAQFMAACLLE